MLIYIYAYIYILKEYKNSSKKLLWFFFSCFAAHTHTGLYI